MRKLLTTLAFTLALLATLTSTTQAAPATSHARQSNQRMMCSSYNGAADSGWHNQYNISMRSVTVQDPCTGGGIAGQGQFTCSDTGHYNCNGLEAQEVLYLWTGSYWKVEAEYTIFPPYQYGWQYTIYTPELFSYSTWKSCAWWPSIGFQACTPAWTGS